MALGLHKRAVEIRVDRVWKVVPDVARRKCDRLGQLLVLDEDLFLVQHVLAEVEVVQDYVDEGVERQSIQQALYYVEFAD